MDSEYGGAGDDSFVVGGDGASHEHLKIDGGPSGNKTLVINDPLFDQEGVPTDITNQYTVSAYSGPGATPGLEPVSVTDSTTDTAITADRVASISIVNVTGDTIVGDLTDTALNFLQLDLAHPTPEFGVTTPAPDTVSVKGGPTVDILTVESGPSSRRTGPIWPPRSTTTGYPAPP